jgi:transitional endoplasmic reticulum ATPase
MSAGMNGDNGENGKYVQPANFDTKKKSITLKVAEAEQRDVGRKIARVDPTVAERLNISTGDALEISSLGKKTTVLNWPARETDKNKGLIRTQESRIKRRQKHNSSTYRTSKNSRC